jgi:YD repeat-containing protein
MARTGARTRRPQITKYLYDLAGRRTRVTHPDPDRGGPLTSAYQAFTYDAKGDVVTRRREDGYVTWYKRNWRGDVVEVTVLRTPSWRRAWATRCWGDDTIDT